MDQPDEYEDLSPEQLRLKNIKDNHRILAELGLVVEGPTDSNEPQTQVKRKSAPVTKPKKKKKPRYLQGPHSHSRHCRIITAPYTSEEKNSSDDCGNSVTASKVKVTSAEVKMPVFKGPKKKLRVLSLFDGIGTGFVALKQLGIEVEVYYTIEIDRDALAIAMANHDVCPLGNVLNLDRSKLERICPIDLVLAAPPCDDLSMVNHRRKGFNGSGKLIFKFQSIQKQIEAICGADHHVFWIMENTGHMPRHFQQMINSVLGMKPARHDAKHFSGQKRARYFWGNIPEMYNFDYDKKASEDLDSALMPNRKALVPHSRTITSCKNSHSIKNGEKGGLVIMNGVQCDIWLQECERLFGFPCHYTDAGDLDTDTRFRLLGRAWSVQMIKHLLAPLKQYYKTKEI